MIAVHDPLIPTRILVHVFPVGVASSHQLETRIRWILSSEPSMSLRLTRMAFTGVLAALTLITRGTLFAEVRVESAQAATNASESASDGATQTRVRELIYVLREHRGFERTDEWGAAIRELVAIGPPALPELLLELKNTQRNATLRGLLFTLRAINDSRAIAPVVEAIPKAQKLSRRGSDVGFHFVNAELHRFMKQHENFPSDDDWVAYGRPVNEILATLHKLSRQPLPDLTKQDPHPTWNGGYWQEWWKAETSSGRAQAESEVIQIPSRDEDLVERDGIRRFGPLFPTGPDQRLSPIVDIMLPGTTCADAPSCLDVETGRLYEYLEGLRYGPEKAYDRLDPMKWKISHGIDIDIDGGADLHLWLIDNDRWDSLDSEVQSEEPFNLGREAISLTPFDKHPTDFKPDQIGTFLFTAREGSRGVLRVYPIEKGGQSRRMEYRLWNRDSIEPHADVQSHPRDLGEWQPAKIVILKEPGFGKQCLFDFEEGKADVLPTSISSPEPLPEIEELLKFGGVLMNDRIAAWARDRGIDLATHRSRVAFGGGASDDVLKALHNGQMAVLTILDAREMRVTAEAFNSLTLAHAREILARDPDSYRVAHLHPPLEPGGPPATYIFDTKSGLIGLLKMLKVGDKLSSIAFEYELANSPEKDATGKR